jgi:hypothetical protein
MTMTYHGPYTHRVSRRARLYTGPLRVGGWSSRAVVAAIAAVLVAAAALAYDVSRTFMQISIPWNALDR